jgi:carbon-monoxide dehydrogenase medium subunit
MEAAPPSLVLATHRMKPAPFVLERPTSVAEAVTLLARREGEARCLAGGQSLIALMNMRVARPPVLIDLGGCRDLDYIRQEGPWLAIGAMTRQSVVEHSTLVRDLVPLVARAMPFLGHPVIRNRGTIGGTLAHADRVAELPGVAVALDAELTALGPNGRRVIPARTFFVGDLTTALAPAEFLCEVRFPIATASIRCAFVEAGNRHHDLALVGIAAQLEGVINGRCAAARLAVVGVGPKPSRLRRTEARLAAGPLDDAAIAEAARQAADEIEPENDLHASSVYRRHVTAALLTRAVCEALQSGNGAVA